MSPALLILMGWGLAFGAQNIDPSNDGSKFAWAENLGWINLQPGGPSGPGVEVSDTGLTGWGWSENAGWISFSCTNRSCMAGTYGVTNDGSGTLGGYAWAENLGWINFAPTGAGVVINGCNGIFSGRAWSENAGWITFSSTSPNPYHVATSWLRSCNDVNSCTTDSCDEATGACVFTNNAGACSDGSACTQPDACQSGVCVGQNPVVCTASDQCHSAGTCDPGTGSCSNPTAAEGTVCGDGNACTLGEACRAGNCVAPVSLTPPAGSPVVVGSNPISIAVGDWNGDGKRDLAVANQSSHNVTILIGNGLGGFSPDPGSPVAVGTNPVSLAVGDLNGDVKLDLAIVNASSNDATILLGNGSGAFTQAAGSPVEVGPSPRFVVIRDWNADGKLDLAVANRFSDFVTIMMGNGLGGFTQAAGSPIPVEAGPYSIAAGDVNADGKLDLAVANNGSNNVTIVLGNGSGGFTQVAGSPVAVGANPESVALADVSGDGKLDLAVANAGSNNVTILLGSGTGGFSQAAGSPLAAGTNPEFVSVADLNGDGTVDLAVANGGSNSITIMLGTGSGVFSEAAGSPVAVGSNPVPVGVGDWNGDGKRDLAVANFSSSNLTILLNNTTSADDGTACTDGNACTTGDVCTSGSCGGTPVPPPSAINNSVRLDKTPTNATISWNDSPNPYNVYRGSRAAGAAWSYNQTCLSPGVAGNSAQDTVAPVPGQLLYYLVSRKSSCNESSLGRDSAGADRPNGAPCGDGP